MECTDIGDFTKSFNSQWIRPLYPVGESLQVSLQSQLEKLRSQRIVQVPFQLQSYTLGCKVKSMQTNNIYANKRLIPSSVPVQKKLTIHTLAYHGQLMDIFLLNSCYTVNFFVLARKLESPYSKEIPNIFCCQCER